MKIALLFDGASALGKTPDLLILETVEAIEAVLSAEGNTVARVPVYADSRWIDRLRRAKADLVFNLCEGVDGVAALEPAVIAAVELFGLPYTGCSSWTTSLCLRKHVVNSVLHRAGLPVPPFCLVPRGSTFPTVGFPAICKPAAEDASIGVEQGSVVRTGRALAARVDAMHERWSEILVQRYIDGREVNVGIVDGQTLPLAEIHFDAMPKRMWRIVSYRSKWETGCDEDLGAAPSCPAVLDPELAREIEGIALSAWSAVGGEGYGRLDFRIDRGGRPWLLEVNANPDLAADAGLARMARVAGMDYPSLIRVICESALTRRAAVSAEAWQVSERLSGVASPADRMTLDLFAIGQQ